jgi:hypothetical protein
MKISSMSLVLALAVAGFAMPVAEGQHHLRNQFHQTLNHHAANALGGNDCGRGICQSEAEALWANYCHDNCTLNANFGGDDCGSGCGRGCGGGGFGRVSPMRGGGCFGGGSDGCGSGGLFGHGQRGSDCGGWRLQGLPWRLRHGRLRLVRRLRQRLRRRKWPRWRLERSVRQAFWLRASGRRLRRSPGRWIVERPARCDSPSRRRLRPCQSRRVSFGLRKSLRILPPFPCR